MPDPRHDVTSVAEKPDHCPFCRSVHVVATAKTITDSTYWRCSTCGEVWNPKRSGSPARPPRSRWW